MSYNTQGFDRITVYVCNSCLGSFALDGVQFVAGDPFALTTDGGDGGEHPYCHACLDSLKPKEIA